MLRFGTGSDPETDCLPDNPAYAHAYNYGSKQDMRTCIPPSIQHIYCSNWLYLVDTGLKSSNGKTAREVLLDIMDAFPGYDLESDEGIERAIDEMVTKLGQTVNFNESSGC